MTELSNPVPSNPPRSQWLDVWDQFKSHRGALMGGALFLFIILAVYLGPMFWDIEATNFRWCVELRMRGPAF